MFNCFRGWCREAAGLHLGSTLLVQQHNHDNNQYYEWICNHMISLLQCLSMTNKSPCWNNRQSNLPDENSTIINTTNLKQVLKLNSLYLYRKPIIHCIFLRIRQWPFAWMICSWNPKLTESALSVASYICWAMHCKRCAPMSLAS